MVCIVDTKGKTYKGKRYFGQSINDFKQNPSLWPGSLVSYFESIPVKERQRGLTVSMLLDWLAQETGIDELSEGSSKHKSYVTLLGRYIRWSYNPAETGAQDVLLLSAIAHCGIIRDAQGLPLNDVKTLARLMNGDYNDAVL